MRLHALCWQISESVIHTMCTQRLNVRSSKRLCSCKANDQSGRTSPSPLQCGAQTAPKGALRQCTAGLLLPLLLGLRVCGCPTVGPCLSTAASLPAPPYNLPLAVIDYSSRPLTSPGPKRERERGACHYTCGCGAQAGRSEQANTQHALFIYTDYCQGRCCGPVGPIGGPVGGPALPWTTWPPPPWRATTCPTPASPVPS